MAFIQVTLDSPRRFMARVPGSIFGYTKEEKMLDGRYWFVDASYYYSSTQRDTIAIWGHNERWHLCHTC